MSAGYQMHLPYDNKWYTVDIKILDNTWIVKFEGGLQAAVVAILLQARALEEHKTSGTVSETRTVLAVYNSQGELIPVTDVMPGVDSNFILVNP